MLFRDKNIDLGSEVEFICKLIFDVLKLPVYFLNKDNELILSFCYGYSSNPLHSDKKRLFNELFNEGDSCEFPLIKSTKFFENYIGINLKDGDTFYGTIILGPSSYSIVSGEDIDALILENNLPSFHKRDLINFYNSIPIIDYTHLISCSQLVYYSIWGKKLETSTVVKMNASSNHLSIKIQNEMGNILSKNRQDFFFHHSDAHEKKLFSCIRSGNVKKLEEQLNLPVDGKYGLLSKSNPIRNRKNGFICSATLATRAAIDGGLDSELAYSLSDSYIQNVEEMSDVNNINALQNDMLCDFAKRVANIKELSYSKSIILCQNYITKHLYDNFSIRDLAKYVGLTQNYLSELFSKEVSLTLSEYIQKEKIEEAKVLLTSSNYSIIEIASWLGFHDQSHFTRIFKKYCETTPKKYREAKITITKN